MKKTKIVKYPDPLLRKKSQEIKDITEDINELVETMVKVMEKEKGIGLSAVQIGELKRVVVINSGEESQVFINPKIEQSSFKKEILEEGCLSFPELFLKVARPRFIKVSALNLKGQKLDIKAQGIMARVFCHEIDHLNGVLFIDRLSFLKRLKVRKALLNSK